MSRLIVVIRCVKLFGVSFKCNTSKKTLTAKKTGKFEFIVMFASLVVIDTGGISKGLRTNTTLVRSLSAVDYFMLHLPRFGTMPFTTHTALVRFISGVELFVSLKRRLKRKLSFTKCTLVGSINVIRLLLDVNLLMTLKSWRIPESLVTFRTFKRLLRDVNLLMTRKR